MFFYFYFDESKGVPSFDQMFKPVLLALQECGGKASVSEMDEKAIKLMNLSEEIIRIMHKESSNRTEVSYRLAWARTYLKKYGLIKNEERGVWSLTEKYDGNIEAIDSERITREVRNQNVQGQDKTEYLTGFESAQAFEKLVSALVMDVAQKDKKSAYFAYSDTLDFAYDIMLPNGIEDIDVQIVCIIKYIDPQSGNSSMSINQIAQSIKTRFPEEWVLFIVNILIPESEKKKFSENVIIWDRDVLIKKIDPEASYVQYLINPKQALIEDLVSIEVSTEEKEDIKKAHTKKIKSSFRNEDMVLFLGAGISIDGGIPLWPTLIKQLHIHMISRITAEKGLSFHEQEMINELAFDNKMESPLLQMRYIKSAFKDDDYYQLVHSALYGKGVNTNTALLNALAKISTPQRGYCGIKSIVTYNFDDLLEKKFEEKDIRFNVISTEKHRQLFDKLNIYHVHGFLSSDKQKITADTNLIFSEEDYHKVYRDAYSWSNLIQLNALRENTCLFIGCSLTDPNVRRLLDVATRDDEPPRHFAFMEKKKIREIKESEAKMSKEIIEIYQRIDDNIQTAYYQQLGLNIIWVDDYQEIPDILESFIE